MIQEWIPSAIFWIIQIFQLTFPLFKGNELLTKGDLSRLEIEVVDKRWHLVPIRFSNPGAKWNLQPPRLLDL